MKFRYTLTVILVLTLLVLAGCGKEDKDKAVETENTDPTAQETKLPTQRLDEYAGTGLSTPVDPVAEKNDTPPAVTTLSPLPEVIAADSVVINGKTRPGKKIYINGQEVVPEKNGAFTFPYNLQVGENQIEVVTLGKEKIEDTQTITIERRPAPPMLTVIAPDSSGTEYLTVTGQTEKGCVVYVDNRPATPDREGKFTAPVQLKEGQNNIIISSTNKQGGTATVQKTVTFTPAKPKLEVIIPEDCNSNQVTISGITDPNATLVYVNDVKADINAQSGVFSGTITLEDGVNAVTVTAINKWGKTNSVSKNIFYFAP